MARPAGSTGGAPDGPPSATPGDAAAAVKVIVTKSGHKIVLDDDATTITVSDQNGNSITLDSDGISLERGGSQVAIGDAEVNVNNGALEIF